MAKSTIWICDGCHEEIKQEKMPGGWNEVEIHICGADNPMTGEKTYGPEDFDLCAQCCTRLRDQSNPKNWAKNA